MDPAARPAAALDGDRALAALNGDPLAALSADPAACRDMAQVRANVDAIDRLIVRLLGRRFGHMTAAARIKTARGAVRDEARKAAIIARVEREAQAEGLPAGLASQLWEMLIEASIAFEFNRFDELRGANGASDGARTRDLRRDRPAL